MEAARAMPASIVIPGLTGRLVPAVADHPTLSFDAPERWLPVVGWEGFYEVSSLGRVRSIPHRTVTGIRGGHVRKATLDDEGRPFVSLSATGKRSTTRKVHVLVAEAFLGPRPDGMEVCHWDGNVTNVALSNLRYDTHSGNERDKRRHGTHHNSRKTHCPRKHKYTPTNTYVNPKGSRECRTCIQMRRQAAA